MGNPASSSETSHFNEGHLDEATRTVLHASRALDVREIDFFRIAWRWWQGTKPNPHVIERAFANYMFHKLVPAWVRQTGREVLRRADLGVLDPDDFETWRYLPDVTPDPNGRVIVAGFSVVALCLVAALTWYAATGNAGRHPACSQEAGQGMAFAEKVARIYTGDKDPFRCADPGR